MEGYSRWTGTGQLRRGIFAGRRRRHRGRRGGTDARRSAAGITLGIDRGYTRYHFSAFRWVDRPHAGQAIDSQSGFAAMAGPSASRYLALPESVARASWRRI